MAEDLDASRKLAESSSAQLTAANQSIEERRRELEIILERFLPRLVPSTLPEPFFKPIGHSQFSMGQDENSRLRGQAAGCAAGV